MAEIDWYFNRPDLAKDYMRGFTDLGARALALFAERQAGKTAFLQKDLTPAAAKQGRIPVYIDLWANRQAPAEGIVAGLKNATLAIEKPGFFKRPLTALTFTFLGHGAGVNLAEQKKDVDAMEPDNELSRMGYWMDRLASATKTKRVLLMVDELQELATHRSGGDIAAALRAGFQRNFEKFEPVFTGSSRDKLEVMFLSNKAPLFKFGDRLDFPKLGKEFVGYIAKRFHEASKLRMDEVQGWTAFEALGRKPGEFIDIVRFMAASGTADLTQGLAAKLRDERQRVEKAMQLQQLTPLDGQVLVAVARAKPLFAQSSLKDYGLALGIESVSISAVQRSLERLRRHELVEGSQERGEYRIADNLLAEQLRARVPLGETLATESLLLDVGDAPQEKATPSSVPAKRKARPRSPRRGA